VVIGEKAGVQNVTILTSNMPAHNHLINASNTQGSAPLPQGNFIAGVVDSNLGNGTSFNAAATPPATLAPTSVGMAGNGVPLNIQPPYLGITYIIAVQGIFPSRN
jgi:microcystin-dependent protein